MKESTLLELKNKVETLGRVNNMLVQELTHLKDLAFGTLSVVKLLPDYEQALELMKEEAAKNEAESEESKLEL